MADLVRVHRFRDIPIKGVNWQPTHFVDEVPISRLCGLCLMIPKRTVRLPCAHFLCESCLAVNSQGGGGRCPLDDKPFEKARCASYDMPIGTAKALQVYCWNEAQGCKFEGALKDMLRHYNNNCLFRSYEGSKCGEAVPNKNVGPTR
nr:TNF receptor-associated factor 6-B-like [Rhipicephalus microplus]XP_037273587.1 TNF receptor-associated factor 6-B-like [Rhipicephalus microplus]